MSASDSGIAMPVTDTTTPTITSIIAATDGACSGNPGPMGHAAVIQFLSGDVVVKEIEISGGASHGTNNVAELTAAIDAVAAIRVAGLAPLDTPIVILCDSQQVTKGMTEWLPNWKRNGWKKSGSKKEVDNKALYMRLDFLTHDLNLTYQWVKGHADNLLNIRVDKLAVAASEAHSRRAA